MSEDNTNAVQTDFGYELIWAKNEHYLGKILVFNQEGKKTSMHFHQNAHKSWFVNHGKFKVRWITTADAKVYEATIEEGATFDIDPVTPIQLMCLSENGSINEVSNLKENDTYHISASGNDKEANNDVKRSVKI